MARFLAITRLLAIFLVFFSSNHVETARGNQEYNEIGKTVRLWWFVFKKPIWGNNKPIRELRDRLVQCGKTGRKDSIEGYTSEYLGTPFITLKTNMEPDCGINTMAAIYEDFADILAGWGEVPYSPITTVRRSPKKRAIKSKRSKLGPHSMLGTVSNVDKMQEHQIELEDAEEDDYIYTNITKSKYFGVSATPEDIYIKLNEEIPAKSENKDSSGSKFDRRAKKSCAEKSASGHKIRANLEYYTERLKITQPPETHIKELGARFYYRATRKCSQGEGVTIYLIDTGVDIFHPVNPENTFYHTLQIL
ncbi:hypothetical protein TWF730_011048 [Orbilia blumenaviensis]|uniref:Peptidase S8/S53 domain-containing protein n=1 Tax=Orbilia blumenaviensis TaxID=1796055 RepID=A0AAV9UK26_9PEZI